MGMPLSTQSPSPAAPHIQDLPALVGALPAGARERVERIFRVDAGAGALVLPPAMQPWVEETFGSVAAVETQTIVRVTNLITLEGTVFNPLRGRRPMEMVDAGDLERQIEATRGGPFCDPESGTPADTFGRVRGRAATSAANVAKSAPLHGLVIFDEHNPLVFTQESIADLFYVALQWARWAHNADHDARYFFMLWNCLWRSGASIVHGHAQMTLTAGMAYPKIEAWRRAALLYRIGHGSDYFADFVAAHEALGLATPASDATILAHLTPIKENEILVVGERPDEGFVAAVYRALDTLVHRLGARSFSLGFYWRPIDAVPEDWRGFPAVVRVVDRGDLASRTSDFGAMELYAASVVAGDPFDVARAIARG